MAKASKKAPAKKSEAKPKTVSPMQQQLDALTGKFVVTWGGSKTRSETYNRILIATASGKLSLQDVGEVFLFDTAEQAEKSKLEFFENSDYDKLKELGPDCLVVKAAQQVHVPGFKIVGVSNTEEGYYPWKEFQKNPQYYRENETQADLVSQDYVAPSIRLGRRSNPWATKFKSTLKSTARLNSMSKDQKSELFTELSSLDGFDALVDFVKQI